MSNNVNLNIMYKFLATFGGNGKGWEEVADADHNQAITYGEFDKFTMSNQEDIFSQGNEDCDTVDELKKLINAFWNTVDTKRTGYVGKTDVRNKFALDDNEMKNIERNVERYNILSNFINNQTEPNFLSGKYKKIWKERLEEKLGDLLEASNLSGDELKNYLAQEYPRIAQECTAECSKMQYMEELVGDGLFNEYYKYGSDDTLNNLIQSYIEGLTENKSLDDINKDIKKIINAYLAQAGINVEGDSPYNLEDLEALGYQANVLNDLQKAVLMPEMIEALWTNEYEGYEKQFNEAVEKFIDELGKNGGNFELINSAFSNPTKLNILIEQFENSSAKQSLDALIHYSNLSDSDIEEEEINGAQLITPGINNKSTDTTVSRQFTQYAEGSFLRAAANLFGYSIARALEQNGIDNPNSSLYGSYQNIISEVCSRIESGYWKYPDDQTKIDLYILTQIFLNHEELIGEDIIDELSLENLKGIVDGLSTEYTDDETKREIAIEYCEILERKGYGKIVEKVFGKDFTSKINEDTIAEIQRNITRLDSEARDARKNFEEQAPTVTGLLESFGTNNSVSGQLHLNTKLEGVEYKTDSPNNVTIDPRGNITISTNNPAEAKTVKVWAEFNGRNSQVLEITIQPSEKPSQSQSTEDISNTDGLLETKFDEDTSTTDIIEYNGYDTMKRAKKYINEAISRFIANLENKLTGLGYDSNTMSIAKANTLGYFYYVIDRLEATGNSRNASTASLDSDEDCVPYYEINGDYESAVNQIKTQDYSQNIFVISGEEAYSIVIKESFIEEVYMKKYNEHKSN